MSGFLTKLWLEHVDGRTWVVCAPLRYQSDLLNGVVVVETGTDTDLASIPRLLWRILPSSGKYNPAAVIHDAGYRGTLRTEDGQRINLIKRLCDRVFLEAMLSCGVNGWIARQMYRAVSIFGRKDLIHARSHLRY